MRFHLLAAALTPVVLCLLGAAATALWPRRILLWLCLIPAWALAVLDLSLLSFQGELSGPILRWCRIDGWGLVVSACALPIGGALIRRWRASAPVALLRGVPWRYGVFQASLAGLGILPLPSLLVSTALLRPWAWRSEAAPVVLGVGAAGALASWPWPGVVDLVSGLTLAALAALVRPVSRAQFAWVALSAALAVACFWRSAVLFRG